MTQIRKALIGITTVSTHVHKPVVMANQSYIDLITDFGAMPVLVTREPEIMDYLDGLLLIGGQDIDPDLYHASQQVSYGPGFSARYHRPLDYAPNRKRDEFEIALYRRAKAQKKPVLGICRGLQLINVAEGGTLYQELPESSEIQHEAGQDGYSHGHFIRIEKVSKTYELMQVEHYASSSLHHQGIEKLGATLKASAYSTDNLIEIIESREDDFWMMALQGHIEQTRNNYPLYDRLVEDFLRACLEREDRA